MSRIQVDIEGIVLSGIPLGTAQARRLAALTQAALERLLRQRGLAQPEQRWEEATGKKMPQINVPADGNESHLADELAEALYRTLDRKA
jgi:hypothetical protein